MEEIIKIKPQSGFQEKFLSSPADIIIGGGSAGGGKTFALLLEPTRHLANKQFKGIILRRTTPMIRAGGGLWDTSSELYPFLGGVPRESSLEWLFGGASLKMSHLEYEKNIFDHQGAQYDFIGFDELTHFTEKQFFYMLTRNRSTSGIEPYVRATTNPDPDSWVAGFLEWWIDDETGFPIPERDGVLRYFIKDGNKIVWGDSKLEVIKKCPHIFKKKEFKKIRKRDLVKSVTFIRGTVHENKILLEQNPAYLANLMSQDEATKAQLLDGNWKITQDGMALCDYLKVNDLFTNRLKTKGLERYITCDAAGWGKDLCVIMVWEGLKVIRVHIITRSKTTKIVEEIEMLREIHIVSKSNCIMDQDGLGIGPAEQGGYIGFSGGASVMVDPKVKKKNKIKENYKNLKTQCWYRMAGRINKGEVQIELKKVMVDGRKTDEVRVGQKVYSVEKLIKHDLRSFKRKNPDKEMKKQMNSKEEQKIILGGRSPDCGDTIMMREYFELRRKVTFVMETL